MEEDKFRFHKIAKLVSDIVKALKEGRFDAYEYENAMDVLQQSTHKANSDAICQAFGIESGDPKKLTFDVVTKYALIHAKNHKDG